MVLTPVRPMFRLRMRRKSRTPSEAYSIGQADVPAGANAARSLILVGVLRTRWQQKVGRVGPAAGVVAEPQRPNPVGRAAPPPVDQASEHLSQRRAAAARYPQSDRPPPVRHRRRPRPVTSDGRSNVSVALGSGTPRRSAASPPPRRRTGCRSGRATLARASRRSADPRRPPARPSPVPGRRSASSAASFRRGASAVPAAPESASPPHAAPPARRPPPVLRLAGSASSRRTAGPRKVSTVAAAPNPSASRTAGQSSAAASKRAINCSPTPCPIRSAIFWLSPPATRSCVRPGSTSKEPFTATPLSSSRPVGAVTHTSGTPRSRDGPARLSPISKPSFARHRRRRCRVRRLLPPGRPPSPRHRQGEDCQFPRPPRRRRCSVTNRTTLCPPPPSTCTRRSRLAKTTSSGASRRNSASRSDAIPSSGRAGRSMSVPPAGTSPAPAARHSRPSVSRSPAASSGLSRTGSSPPRTSKPSQPLTTRGRSLTRNALLKPSPNRPVVPRASPLALTSLSDSLSESIFRRSRPKPRSRPSNRPCRNLLIGRPQCAKWAASPVSLAINRSGTTPAASRPEPACISANSAAASSAFWNNSSGIDPAA